MSDGLMQRAHLTKHGQDVVEVHGSLVLIAYLLDHGPWLSPSCLLRCLRVLNFEDSSGFAFSRSLSVARTLLRQRATPPVDTIVGVVRIKVLLLPALRGQYTYPIWFDVVPFAA